MPNHDYFFKMMMTNISVVKAFLEVHLPREIYERCDLSTLQANPTELEAENIIESQTSQNADIIYQVSIDGEKGYIYILIEHQSRIDPYMRFRLLRYQIGILHAHLKRHQQNKLPMVIPMVFYAGREDAEDWDFNLASYFEEAEWAIEYLFRKTIFIDVTKISDQEILKHKQAGLLELVQKHIMIDDTAAFAKNLSQTLQNNPVSDEIFNNMIKYIFSNKDTENYQQFLDELNQANQEHQGDIMTIEERIRQSGWCAGVAEGKAEGKAEGMKLGIQEGERKAFKTIAKEMLAKKMPSLLIRELTGLTEADLKALAKF